jgi:hypothetical protein
MQMFRIVALQQSFALQNKQVRDIHAVGATLALVQKRRFSAAP